MKCTVLQLNTLRGGSSASTERLLSQQTEPNNKTKPLSVPKWARVIAQEFKDPFVILEDYVIFSLKFAKSHFKMSTCRTISHHWVNLTIPPLHDMEVFFFFCFWAEELLLTCHTPLVLISVLWCTLQEWCQNTAVFQIYLILWNRPPFTSGTKWLKWTWSLSRLSSTT